jgi:hypothetical protein
MSRIIGRPLAFVLAFAAASACSPTQPSGESDALSVAEPAFLVPETLWRMAPAGCEGLIDEDLFFIARAQNEPDPDLGVVVDGDGVVVCVDTWESIRIELDRLKGDPSPDPMRPMGLDGRRPR